MLKKAQYHLIFGLGLSCILLLACMSIPTPSPTAVLGPSPTVPPIQTMVLPAPLPTETPLPGPTPTPTPPMIQLGEHLCSLPEAQDFLLELSATLTIIQEAVITADLVGFDDRAQLLEIANGLEFDTAWLSQIDPPECLAPLVEEMRLAAEQYIALFRATAEADPGATDEEGLEFLRTAPEHLANARALLAQAEEAIAAAQESAPEE